MSVDASHILPLRAALGARGSIRARVALGAAASASVALSYALALQRATPRYFPDEYLYATLARSVADGEGLRVLGDPFRSPAVLEPLVSALAWLPNDPELAFRLTQLLHVAAMAVAVVPVALLARRLELRPWLTGFACGASLVLPGLLYGSYVTADALAYLLALCAVAAGVRSLARPTVATQALFLGAAGLATAARLQYVVLVPAFVVAALGTERWAARAAARRFWPTGVSVAIGAVAAAVLGAGALGRYADVTGFHVSSEALLWTSRSAFLLALAAGAAIVPAAAAWLAGAGRSAHRARRGFGLMVALVLLGLLAMCALVAAETDSPRFFERYLLIATPLAALAFGCWVEDGRPRRWIGLAVAGVLVAAVTRLPLSTYAESQGAADSPLLLALRNLAGETGLGEASLLAALVVTGCLAVGAWALAGRPAAARWACGVTLLVLATISVGSRLEDQHLSNELAAGRLGANPSWLDALGERDVLLVRTAGSHPAASMTQAVWNGSITRAATLGDGKPMDGVSVRLGLDAHGTLTLDGSPVTSPLLVATDAARAIFADAETVAGAPSFELVRPQDEARLAVLAEGLGTDGWLGAETRVQIFAPAASGRCRAAVLRLSLPAGRRPTPIDVSAGGRTHRTLVTPGRPTTLRFVTLPDRPLTATLTAPTATTLPAGADRITSVRATLSSAETACARSRGQA